MDTSSSVNRAALGSLASLGDLYDARRDDFCGISIFKKSIPSSARTIIDSQFSDIHLVSTEDFSEKVQKLDVSAELQVSVLAGLFKLQGSARYLGDHKTSARSVKSSLVYNVKTKQESLNIYHEDLRDAFSIDAIENGVATHVVVAIEWGANSIVTYQYENKENRDVKEISGSLSAQLEKISLSISGKASVEYHHEDKASCVKFDVRMYGDILPKNGELPTTFEGALDVMKQLPSFVASSNDGKGKPLSYRLIPIALLKNYLKFTIQTETVIKSLEETSLVRVVQLFDQMTRAQQKLNDFYQDAFEFKCCVLPEDLKKITDLKNQAQLQEISFKSELRTILTQIRSGQMNLSQLENLLEKIESSDVSPQKIIETLASWSSVIERTNFVRMLVTQGATFIGYESSLDQEILKNFEAKSYILYFSQNGKTAYSKKWAGNWQLFFQEMKKKTEGHVYLVVDCDIHLGQITKSGPNCIQIMQNCQILVHDLLEEQLQINQTSYVQPCEFAKLNPAAGIPKIRAPLTLICPGKKCNRFTVHDWHCRNCKVVVEYGFDQHFYCKCGKTPAALVEFKCSDPKHGITYERHDTEYMQHILSTLQPFGELNILVMGETADKRIAWMQEFASFLKYDSLEKFEKANESKQHELGEKLDPKRSIHLFEIGTTKIRFISEGVKSNQNEKVSVNGGDMKELLTSLSYLERINAICVIFDPESPNVNAMFQNYFGQLTECFEQRARNNMLFSFGSTGKQTNGLFGQAMLTLKQLMWANNEKQIVVCDDILYCFKRKCGESASLSGTADSLVQFSKEEGGSSWRENASEAHRMLNYIRQLKPIPMASKTTKPVFGCDMEFDLNGDKSKEINLSLFERRALKPGDGVSIRGYVMQGIERLRIFVYGCADFWNEPIELVIRKFRKMDVTINFNEGKGSKPFRRDEHIRHCPIEKEQHFELKIASSQVLSSQRQIEDKI